MFSARPYSSMPFSADPHIRASVIKTHTTDGLSKATKAQIHSTDTYLIQSAAVSFLQRDNWRNGSHWIGPYGSQGYSIYNLGGTPDVIPSWIAGSSSGMNFLNPWITPGSYTDPRYVQIPGQPGITGVSTEYTSATGSMSFNFTDGLTHAISLLFIDPQYNGRRGTISVVDANTAAVLDATRDIGDFSTTAVYMVYNASGSFKFNLTCTSDPATTNLTVVGWFVDPKRAVNGQVHSTDSKLYATTFKAHASDALLRKTTVATHTSDALSRLTSSKIHTTGAFLKATVTKTHTTDSFLPTTVTKIHTGNALLGTTASKVHTVDALLRTTVARIHTDDSLLRATRADTHTADAFLRDGDQDPHYRCSAVRDGNQDPYHRCLFEGDGGQDPQHRQLPADDGNQDLHY